MNMLSSRILYEGISWVLESLKNADTESARKKIVEISAQVRSEKERGALLAAQGICTSISKRKEGTMQSWDQGRVIRAAQSIVSSQMADDFDRGYAETLLSYSKLIELKT